ncbi:Ktr system potassium transporter B [Salimicrobium jeotgali]|uniref:Ktr system potassium transporter B n=1 Tax=Salimicrobium jeotgali TaxID=1230341 RepID=K2G903_9BACI|nr:TrkH family potassium uptake protein [Salimicrobium jeotgali]AKG05300.1 Ktr system potassium transporter B [Salimicrobium jeotgali]EKE30862.1 potassium uptake TrkH family transporter [Salimicrobium jeotgali]MBM7697636.1 trk system potassium uptake protein TrkH [Salimicrobium jeotgali]
MNTNKLNPPQIIISIFIGLIAIGTLLLSLPIANTEGISFIDALFTATSAMTVTGLIVVDTGTAYTLFGQIVILALIQLGGLGIMTFAVLIYVAVGKKIGIKQRLLLKQALNQSAIGGVVRLAIRLLIFSIIVETIAVIFLSLKWIPEMGLGQGIYASIFHSISAFNNAGFSIWSDSLSAYAVSPVVNIVISFLFIIGGIGFTVVFDMWNSKEFTHLALQTKLMIVGTLTINVLSFFIIFFLEYNNPNTLANLSSLGKIQAAYFQAVTPRTAGFNTLDIGQMEEASLFFIITLMFIGGGSASTAGGIKLTTALAILLATISFFKDKERVTIYRRSLTYHVILKALALTVGSMCVVIITIFILDLTENAPFLMIVFESVSAFGTVGLSMGLTGSLTTIGKFVIILTMLIGKLGPLTFAFAFAKQSPDPIKYPSEEILTG